MKSIRPFGLGLVFCFLKIIFDLVLLPFWSTWGETACCRRYVFAAIMYCAKAQTSAKIIAPPTKNPGYVHVKNTLDTFKKYLIHIQYYQVLKDCKVLCDLFINFCCQLYYLFTVLKSNLYIYLWLVIYSFIITISVKYDWLIDWFICNFIQKQQIVSNTTMKVAYMK